jgi:D-sedoheptulose 7-phosphate isomerase
MRLNDDCAREMIRAHLLRSAEVKQSLAEQCAAEISEAANLIAHSLQGGGKMLLCGNGGSAADCQHIATEFTSILSKDFLRPAMAAIALTTDASFLTASANDFGFETIFARQVEALGRSGDVLVGISTSGNSSNVINAVSRARELALHTVVLTGGTGGRLAYLADVSIKVPSDSTSHIQESHIAIGHVVCAVVEQMLFGDQRQDGATADSARELTALIQD